MILIFLIVAETAYASLVGYWNFNGDISDKSGNGYNGTNYGGATIGDNGKFGQALSFDGSDDYINVGDVDVLGQITISAWVKTTDGHITGNSGGIVSKWDTRPGYYGPYTMVCTANVASIVIASNTSSGSGAGGSSTAALDNTWHCFTGTYDGQKIRFYIDGILIDDADYTAGMFNSDFPTLIGREIYTNAAGMRLFHGAMDDVSIWNEALSSDDILQVMNFSVGAYNFLKTDNNFLYSAADMEELYDHYLAGPGEGITINGKEWQYFANDPEWVLAIDPNPEVGDYFVQENMYYIKLGSGVGAPIGGGVPELPAGIINIMTIFASMVIFFPIQYRLWR